MICFSNKVFWITGLSGSGKTTIGKYLANCLKENGDLVIILDGDEMRQVFGNDLNYSFEERNKLSMSYARMCKMLSEQAVNVVCTTISMFDSVRKWNRENIQNYKEIYIRSSLKTLVSRDSKELYSQALSGTIKNVVGMDMSFEEPKHPDLIIDNNGQNTPEKIAEIIFNTFIGRVNNES